MACQKYRKIPIVGDGNCLFRAILFCIYGSTDDAIHQLVEKIQDAKNKKLQTMVISLDTQGAIDHLQYNSIRNSLDEINFPSHTTESLKDILNDRKVTIQTSEGPVSWSQQ
ncbi:hypothetical protein AVEN_115520-1 [Araneus ventricosus]|uniref:OTU domain-containing protein n=1 Tax=Araneus ventricosus TaxID=182803 RepID=A0A4Y2CLG0_ARAVE|nr:hypothetical protein AVEN_115520-1 [Araneus ventricosus]